MPDPHDRPSHSLIDSNTTASHPGEIRVDWGRYLRCYPKLPLFLCGVVFVAAPVAASPLFIKYKKPNTPPIAAGVAAAVVAAFCWLRFTVVPQHMFYGCTCPAVVIDPVLQWIAVSTDLTCSPDRSFPAIKILEVPLRRATSKPFQMGERLTTVALYHGSGASGHWDDFSPVPVICATADEMQVRGSLTKISETDWRDLQDDLRRLGSLPKPGLHMIDRRK